MNMTLDQSMNRFRIASRELFNQYFRISKPYASNDQPWLLDERFKEIQDLLFRALVTERSSIANVSYGDVHPDIRVTLRLGEVCTIMVNRELNSGYWDDPTTEVTREAELLFMAFFDWDDFDYRDNQYVRVRINNWPSHPDLVGKDALIEALFVRFDCGPES